MGEARLGSEITQVNEIVDHGHIAAIRIETLGPLSRTVRAYPGLWIAYREQCEVRGPKLLEIARDPRDFVSEHARLRAFVHAHAAQHHAGRAVRTCPTAENNEGRTDVEVIEVHDDRRINITRIEKIDSRSKVCGLWFAVL